MQFQDTVNNTKTTAHNVTVTKNQPFNMIFSRVFKCILGLFSWFMYLHVAICHVVFICVILSHGQQWSFYCHLWISPQGFEAVEEQPTKPTHPKFWKDIHCEMPSTNA